MTARIPGLDLARALAIFGMVAVNFELTLRGPAQALMRRASGSWRRV